MDNLVLAKIAGLIGVGFIIVKDNPCAYALGVISGLVMLIVLKGINRWMVRN